MAIGFPGIGVRDGCEPPCTCWEVNPGSLQEQWVLLTRAISLDHKFYVLKRGAFMIHDSYMKIRC